MIKLLEILTTELSKPEKIYQDDNDNLAHDISNLSRADKEKLYQQGTLLVPIKSEDPSRSGSAVINLPKLEQVKKEIIKHKREIEAFRYHPDDNIKNVAKEINNSYNKLGKLIVALDKMIHTKRQSEI